jgi:DNA-binding NarL/FixJ family response regulator
LLVESSPLGAEKIFGAAWRQAKKRCVSWRWDCQIALNFIHQKEQMFDLIAVGLGLPDVDGVQVIRACHPQHLEVPIALISVMACKPLVLNAIGAGAWGCIAQERVGAENHPGTLRLLSGG